ncbi:MAG: LysR family transcriptional regulator [Actinomycetota bacterium]
MLAGTDYELRHLRSFAELARTMHFGRAASSLAMSQSALSHQISQLEERMGAKLFERTTRRVRLTPAGHRLERELGRLLPELDDLAEEVRAVADGRAGRLRIGSVGSLTYGPLPVALRTFHGRYPQVEFRVRGEMLTPDQVRALQHRELDVGLLRPPMPSAEGIDVEHLGHEELLCALPAEHTLADESVVPLAALAAAPTIAYRRGSAVRTVTDGILVTDPAFEVAETHTLLSLVAGSLGVAVVPASVARVQLAGVVYRPLATDQTIGIALARPSDSDSVLTERFADAVRESLAAEGD